MAKTTKTSAKTSAKTTKKRVTKEEKQETLKEELNKVMEKPAPAAGKNIQSVEDQTTSPNQTPTVDSLQNVGNQVVTNPIDSASKNEKMDENLTEEDKEKAELILIVKEMLEKLEIGDKVNGIWFVYHYNKAFNKKEEYSNCVSCHQRMARELRYWLDEQNKNKENDNQEK